MVEGLGLRSVCVRNDKWQPHLDHLVEEGLNECTWPIQDSTRLAGSVIVSGLRLKTPHSDAWGS